MEVYTSNEPHFLYKVYYIRSQILKITFQFLVIIGIIWLVLQYSYILDQTQPIFYYQKLSTIVYRDCDVSYNCNDPVNQSQRSVLTFVRNSVLFIFLYVKIKEFWLMGKIWGFMLQRFEYQRLFSWQQHLEMLFCFYFMRAYKFCSI